MLQSRHFQGTHIWPYITFGECSSMILDERECFLLPILSDDVEIFLRNRIGTSILSHAPMTQPPPTPVMSTLPTDVTDIGPTHTHTHTPHMNLYRVENVSERVWFWTQWWDSLGANNHTVWSLDTFNIHGYNIYVQFKHTIKIILRH